MGLKARKQFKFKIELISMTCRAAILRSKLKMILKKLANQSAQTYKKKTNASRDSSLSGDLPTNLSRDVQHRLWPVLITHEGFRPEHSNSTGFGKNRPFAMQCLSKNSSSHTQLVLKMTSSSSSEKPKLAQNFECLIWPTVSPEEQKLGVECRLLDGFELDKH